METSTSSTEIKNNKDKVIFSAIKPTGNLTIGNYIGAVKNFLAMQEEYTCYYAVADLHAITIDIPPAVLRNNTLDLFAMFVAFGLDPKKCTLFVQSHVPSHAELGWVLNCYTQFGEARRMTQFKDKSQKAPENVNVGLFDYPVLMAADILIYNADYVPIGQDQRQHLELARTIAERFNNKFSPTFTVPEGIYPKYGAKVYSLQNPLAKMGKSEDDPNGTILIKDDADTIARKFRRAVTDSIGEINFDTTNQPGVSNLMTIYSAFAGCDIEKAKEFFAGKNYAFLKEETASAVIEGLRPIQKTFTEIRSDKAYLASLMQIGAEQASRVARRTNAKVFRKVGFVQG